MRLLCALFAVLTLASASAINAFAGTLSTRGIPDRSDLYHNASSLLGWNLVGMFNTTAQLGMLCDSFDTFSARLGAAGLVVEDIKAPICSFRTPAQMPTVRDINSKLIQYYSEFFVTALLNAMDLHTSRTAPFKYLCQTGLSYGALEQFGLDPFHIMGAVCTAGDVPTRPEEEGEATNMTLTAVDDFYKNITLLFAYEVATAADSVGELNALCNALPSYRANLEAVRLDFATANATMCSFSAPLQATDSSHVFTIILTEIFLVIVRNSGRGISDWDRQLCLDFDASSLTNVGLDWEQIFREVCAVDTA